CFALAFGTAPGDVALIQEHCGDGDLRVRRTAFYALAIRASPFTDVELLLGGLEDGDATVRRRAGEGLGKCVAKDSDDIRAVRGALVKRLHDDSPMVVVAAAQALIRIGSADDIAKIKEAAGRVEPASLKKVLEELVSKSCNR
ncbi:MAG: HEAT repeat domain-containing protein, partial [Planctomycetota bacterium]